MAGSVNKVILVGNLGRDPESRAFHFYLRLPNAVVMDQQVDGNRFIEWRYKPGQRLELRITRERWEDRIVLPIDAIVDEGAETFVYRQDGKSFKQTPVHVEYREPVVDERLDLGVPGVAERLYYDPAARAYIALTMPGTSSAVLLGADRLVAGGPVLGTAEVEAFVDEIAEALAEAGPVPATDDAAAVTEDRVNEPAS